MVYSFVAVVLPCSCLFIYTEYNMILYILPGFYFFEKAVGLDFDGNKISVPLLNV